jgi:hypothetical protein
VIDKDLDFREEYGAFLDSKLQLELAELEVERLRNPSSDPEALMKAELTRVFSVYGAE